MNWIVYLKNKQVLHSKNTKKHWRSFNASDGEKKSILELTSSIAS